LTEQKQKVALVTGSAGFIGFHVSKRLLEAGWKVIGVDCMSDYYDVQLKHERESLLFNFPNYISIHEAVETKNVIMTIFEKHRPNTVVHLAAQAGVRYSIENPRAYLESNIIGTFELLEAARKYPPAHMLLASTSSAYGANSVMPYNEKQQADNQVSFYAATKKSNEVMAHSYAHLFNLPTTMFRFFTVYGPWGRPDMAAFKFTNAIINDRSIDVYNSGELWRDFTYIDDLVEGIIRLIDAIPKNMQESSSSASAIDNLSPVAPFRIVNIGNANKIKLLDFISTFEVVLNKKATKNFMPMQQGDVLATWADTSLLKHLTGFEPNTNIMYGVSKFVEWYTKYYEEKNIN